MATAKPPEPPPQPNNRIHFDKTINLGHILTTASLVVGIFAWGNAIDRRLAVIEEKARHQVEVDTGQDQEFRRYVTEMREDIRDLSRKIDKLIESSPRR